METENIFEGKSKLYIQAYNSSKENLLMMHQPNKRMMALMYFPNGYFCRWVILHNDLIQGCKDAFFDILSDDIGGFEPTFETEEGYNWWNNLSDKYFQPKYSLLIDNKKVSYSNRTVSKYHDVNSIWGHETAGKLIGFELKEEFKIPSVIFAINQ